jgi:hypothetical protein
VEAWIVFVSGATFTFHLLNNLSADGQTDIERQGGIFVSFDLSVQYCIRRVSDAFAAWKSPHSSNFLRMV